MLNRSASPKCSVWELDDRGNARSRRSIIAAAMDWLRLFHDRCADNCRGNPAFLASAASGNSGLRRTRLCRGGLQVSRRPGLLRSSSTTCNYSDCRMRMAVRLSFVELAHLQCARRHRLDSYYVSARAPDV